MTDPAPPSLTLLAALDLVRNKKPAEWTADEIAGLRARLQASSAASFSSVGGVAAVKRFVAEAELALATQGEQPSDAPPVGQPPPASTSRSIRHKFEVLLYTAAVLAAEGGLYVLLRHDDTPSRTSQKVEEKPKEDSTSAVTQATGAAKGREDRVPDEMPNPDPAPTPFDPNVWVGWHIDRGKDTTTQQKDEWDRSDPSNPIPANALLVSGGPLRLTRALPVRAEEKWLMVEVRPINAVLQGGVIGISMDGKQIAQASIGAGETDWPLYVPLEGAQQPQRKIEITFTPSVVTQQIVFWGVRQVVQQSKKPLPESPLITALRSADPTVRLQGATAAAQTVDPLALKALVRLLSDTNREVRRAAVSTLPQYNTFAPSLVVDSLAGKLNDPDPEIRRLAAQTLTSFDTDGTWAALTRTMLKSADTQLRLQITQQLAGKRQPIVRAALEKLLSSVDDALRLAAVNSLSSLPNPDVSPLLVRALDDPEPAVRRAAANALAGRNDSAAEAAMVVALTTHSDAHVRRTALACFHRLPTFKAQAAIRAALESPDDALRRNAVPALARRANEEAHTLLISLLHSPDEILRRQAADVLWNRPTPAVEEALAAALPSGQDPVMRTFAWRRFSTKGRTTPRFIPALREAATSPNAIERAELMNTLATVRQAVMQEQLVQRKSRAKALEALATPPWSETFTLLVAMLDDPAFHVRTSAATALCSDPHPDADAIMPRLLQSPDVQIRQLAVRRFAQHAMPSENNVAFLKLCLADPDAAVRTAAVVALTRINTPETKTLVAVVIDDPAYSVREAVLRARRLDPARVREDALLPAEAKVGGPQSVPALIKLLSDPKPSVRQAAAERLRQDPADVAEQAMHQALKTHPDVFVRRSAAQSLLRKPPTPAVMEMLRELIRDPDVEIRETALNCLSQAPSPEVVALLTPLLSDPAAQVRLRAATVLSQRPEPAAEDVLLPLLSHPDWQIRQPAVQRFVRAPSPRAMSGLSAASAAAEPEIRTEALRALAQLKDPAIFPLLARGLEDPATQVRATAAEILRSRSEPESTEPMLKALASSPYADVRHQAASKFEAQPIAAALGPLTTAAKHEDDALRVVAIRALGRLNDPTATTVIVEALNDFVPEVRSGAATILVTRLDDRAEAAMIGALNSHGDVEVRRLAASRFQSMATPKALPGLTKAIRDVDDQLRLQAARALHKTAGAEALDLLILALDDPNEMVREAALGALVSHSDPRAKSAVATHKANREPGP